MICFIFTVRAPSAKTFRLNAWKASSVSGVNSRRFCANSRVDDGNTLSDIGFRLLAAAHQPQPVQHLSTHMVQLLANSTQEAAMGPVRRRSNPTALDFCFHPPTLML